MPRDYSRTNFRELRAKGYADEVLRRRLRRERLSRDSPVLRGWHEVAAVLHLSTSATKVLARSAVLPLYTSKLHGRHVLVAFRDELLAAYRDLVLEKFVPASNVPWSKRVGTVRTAKKVLELLRPLLGRVTRPPTGPEWADAAQDVCELMERLVYEKTQLPAGSPGVNVATGKWRPGTAPNPHARGKAAQRRTVAGAGTVPD
jgi:hypothetical protein